MENIEIEGYSVIVPNRVYGQKIEQLKIRGRQLLVPCTRLIHIRKYRVPLEDEVLDAIRGVANSWFLGKSESRLDDEYIEMFHSTEIKRIAEGKAEALDHLRDHIPDQKTGGKCYIEINSGLVPNPTLELLKRTAPRDAEIQEIGYRKVSDIHGEFDLYVRLEDGNKFPDILELQYLVDRGVRNSDVFYVEGSFIDYSTIAANLKSLQHALNLPENIVEIRDISEVFSRKRVIDTAIGAADCLASHNFTHSGLGKGFEGQDLGGYKDCSGKN